MARARLFASLDQSAATWRHTWLYSAIMLARLTNEFDLLVLGVMSEMALGMNPEKGGDDGD